MSQKKGNFFEQHIDKIVLGVVGIICLWLSLVYVLPGAYSIEIDGNQLGPGEIDHYIKRRVVAIEQKLEEQRLAQERLAEETQAARDELKQRRQEAEAYRGQVSEHFGDTSRLLRDFTLQYRAVYEQCEDTTTEDLRHQGEVTDGNEEECTILIKIPF